MGRDGGPRPGAGALAGGDSTGEYRLRPWPWPRPLPRPRSWLAGTPQKPTCDSARRRPPVPPPCRSSKCRLTSVERRRFDLVDDRCSFRRAPCPGVPSAVAATERVAAAAARRRARHPGTDRRPRDHSSSSRWRRTGGPASGDADSADRMTVAASAR